MHNSRFAFVCATFVGALALLATITTIFSPHPKPLSAQDDEQLTGLAFAAAEAGSVRVIVQLDVADPPAGIVDEAARADFLSDALQMAQDAVVSGLSVANHEVTAEFKTIPYLGLEVTADGLNELLASPTVLSIFEDTLSTIDVESSGAVIGSDAVAAAGLDGEGTTIAILDTGVDITHAAFNDPEGNSRIVSEACYSSNYAPHGAISVCAGSVPTSTIAGSGDDCSTAVAAYPGAIDACGHGTHVAGIAAGYSPGEDVYGVAPAATIIAVQVFTLFDSVAICGHEFGCVASYTSNQLQGLERVYELRNSYDIASVNMSLGSGQESGYCNGSALESIITNLASAGIATVIAAGNDDFVTEVASPACIESAITVGSTNDDDTIASYSNIGPQIDLLAPGTTIYSAIPGGGFENKSGTSMAAPQIAGAWAILKELAPNSGVDTITNAFTQTATLIDDQRSGGVYTQMPRINILDAANTLSPSLTNNLTFSTEYLIPGETLTVTIDINNDLAFTANNVVITATVTNGLIFDNDSLSGDAVVSSVGDETIVTWTTNENLDAGQSTSRTFTASRPAGSTQGKLVTVGIASSGDNVTRETESSSFVSLSTINNCGFSDNFETGSWGLAWAAESTVAGRARVSNLISDSGDYSLILDDGNLADGLYSESYAILNVNLENAENIVLDFDWANLADEYDALYDGVFIRENASSAWVKIYDFTGSAGNGVYNAASIDLASEASTAGINLTSNFQIRFGFYDNFSANPDQYGVSDGYSIDDVSLSCSYNADPLMQSLEVDQTTAQVNQAVNYTLAVSNPGLASHSGISITATLTEGMNFSGPINLEDGSSTTQISPQSVFFNDENLAGLESITFTLPISVPAGVTAGSVLPLLITIGSNQQAEPVTISESITIENSIPVAITDTITVNATGITQLDVLSNDSDLNGDELLITSVGNPTSGIASNTQSSITYTPVTGFKGADTFSYIVSDQQGGTDTGIVNLTVPNTAPIAADDMITATWGLTVSIQPLDNDSDSNGDSLVIDSISTPSMGLAEISGNTIIYTANTDSTGEATFSYVVSDGDQGTDEATITVVIETDENNPVEDPILEPIAVETFEFDAAYPGPQSFGLSEGQLFVEFPADSIPEESKGVLFQKYSAPSSELPGTGAGAYFHLNLIDLSDQIIENPVFEPPIRLTIQYFTAQMGDVPEHDLQFYYFDTIRGRWVSIPVIERDIINNTITMSLSHFTEFAVADSIKIYTPSVRR